jgi:hypothetical protein
VIEGEFEQPWPPEVASALGHFVQGSVVERPPAFFWADPSHALHKLAQRTDDDPTPLPADGEEVVIDDDDRPEYGVITSQTCDIQDAERPKKPFVHIAPVTRADPNWPESRIKAGRYTTYLHWVPMVPEGLWVADLRLQVPVDKGWLVGRKSTVFDGFPDDMSRVAFAEKIAAQASRRALSDPVIRHIANPMRTALEKLSRDSGEREEKLDPVVEFALRFSGSELAPTVVQLVVLSHTPVPEDVRSWYRAWWAGNVAEHDVGASVLEPDFQLLEVMTADDYRRLVILDWQHLSPDDDG